MRRSAYQSVLFVPLMLILFLTTAFTNIDGTLGQKEGIFYADTLYWSGETKEVWLKGKLMVKFGKNNFKGVGDFSGFGKVVHLIVGGQKASPNVSMDISGKKCKVIAISKEEAMEKYGLEGEFGALEITISQ